MNYANPWERYFYLGFPQLYILQLSKWHFHSSSQLTGAFWYVKLDKIWDTVIPNVAIVYFSPGVNVFWANSTRLKIKSFPMWYNLLAKSISASNHMFGRAIWDKLPKCIFENSETALVKRVQFQNFQKSRGWFIPKIARTKCDYWLITSSQQTRWIETNIF